MLLFCGGVSGFSSKKMGIQRGLGHWKIAPTINLPSALAVASAIGWERWRGAILHNSLIVQGEANPQGLNYKRLLCNLALGVVERWDSALAFERWKSSALPCLFYARLALEK